MRTRATATATQVAAAAAAAAAMACTAAARTRSTAAAARAEAVLAERAGTSCFTPYRRVAHPGRGGGGAGAVPGRRAPAGVFEAEAEAEGAMWPVCAPRLRASRRRRAAGGAEVSAAAAAAVNAFAAARACAAKRRASTLTRGRLQRDFGIAGGAGAPLQHAALGAILAEPCVTAVLVGARRPTYVEDTLRFAEGQVSRPCWQW